MAGAGESDWDEPVHPHSSAHTRQAPTTGKPDAAPSTLDAALPAERSFMWQALAHAQKQRSLASTISLDEILALSQLSSMNPTPEPADERPTNVAPKNWSVLKPDEYGIHLIGECLLESQPEPWIHEGVPTKGLTAEALVLVLQALLIQWRSTDAPLIERLEAASWLEQVAATPPKRHKAFVRAAIQRNGSFPCEVQARLFATNAAKDAAAPGEQRSLTVADFPEAAGFEHWRSSEAAELQQMLHAQCRLPKFAGQLRIVPMSAVVRKGALTRKGRGLRACLCMSPKSSLHAPVCWLKLLEGGVAKATAVTPDGQLLSDTKAGVTVDWPNQEFPFTVTCPTAEVRLELRDTATLQLRTPNSPAAGPTESIGSVRIHLDKLLPKSPVNEEGFYKLLSRRRKRDILYRTFFGKNAAVQATTDPKSRKAAEMSMEIESKQPEPKHFGSKSVVGRIQLQLLYAAETRTIPREYVTGPGNHNASNGALSAMAEAGTKPLPENSSWVSFVDPRKSSTGSQRGRSSTGAEAPPRVSTTLQWALHFVNPFYVRQSRGAHVAKAVDVPASAVSTRMFWQILQFMWARWSSSSARPPPIILANLPGESTSDAVPPAHKLKLPPGVVGVCLPDLSTLQLVGAIGQMQRVRPAMQLLLLLTLLLRDWVHNDVPYLQALESLLSAITSAAHKARLTHAELRLLNNANGRILLNAVRIIERFHITFNAQLHVPGMRTLARVAGLALRWDADLEPIAESLRPHFKAAVLLRMSQHAELLKVHNLNNHLDVLYDALAMSLEDLEQEKELEAVLPSRLGLVALSCQLRYGMISAAVLHTWKREPIQDVHTQRAVAQRSAHGGSSHHGGVDERHVIAYDELTEELDKLFKRMHAIMVDAGVSEALESPTTRVIGRGNMGVARLLPGAGVQLLDFDALLAPSLHGLIERMHINIEVIVNRLLSQEQFHRSPDKLWKALPGVQYSHSVIELSRQLDSSFETLAQRTIHGRPLDLRISCATNMMQQAGIILRHYVGFVESLCIRELAPAADAANVAGLLNPAVAEIFASNADSVAALRLAPSTVCNSDEDPPHADPRKSETVLSTGHAMPGVVITRTFAVKLNNLEAISQQQRNLELQLAGYLDAAAADVAAFSPRPSSARPSIDSFMSDVSSVMDASERSSAGAASHREGGARASRANAGCLPPAVSAVAHEIEQHTRRSRLTVVSSLAAVVGSFVTRQIAALLQQIPDEDPIVSANNPLKHHPKGKGGKNATPWKGAFGSAVKDGKLLQSNPDEAANVEDLLYQQVWHAGTLQAIISRTHMSALQGVINRELQVMNEHLMPCMFEIVLSALWAAVVTACESILLNTCPVCEPLTRRQAYALQHVHSLLMDFCHGEGAGLPVQHMKAASAVLKRLFELFSAPAEALRSEYERLWSTQAGASGAETAGADLRAGHAARQLTLLDIVHLLHQRAADPLAQDLVAKHLKHVNTHALRVIFNLPTSEKAVLTSDGKPVAVSCTLAGSDVKGCLYLTDKHLGFSSMNLQKRGIFFSQAPLLQNTVILMPLTRVTRMAKTFQGRSRALACTLFDKSQHVFYAFDGDHGRDTVEEAVRLHVMGSNSLLDRHLRGLVDATAATALALPNGQTIQRSYPCSKYMLGWGSNWRGVLYVCSTMAVFDGQDAARRVTVRFADITKVDLAKGSWSGSFSVRIAFQQPPYQLELCEIASSSVGEEMVAELLDCMSRAAQEATV